MHSCSDFCPHPCCADLTAQDKGHLFPVKLMEMNMILVFWYLISVVADVNKRN